MATEITKVQRKYLRALANPIDATVMIGKQGVTDAILTKLEHELNAHELIKVRFLEFKDERVELTNTLVESSGAALVGIIGHVAILYRPKADPAERTIRLPAA
jgi:RNA-binding protein